MWWTATFLPVWTVSLLPPSSRTPWEGALEAVDGDLVARNPVALIPAARSAVDCPLEWLPYLASERSVDEYSGAWPEERRREVTAGSFPFHQVKGTRRALERALTPLGYQVQVVEWFEGVIRPAYTFRLTINLGGFEVWNAAQRSELIRVANKAKNAHTKLDLIEYRRVAGPAFAYIGGATRKRRTLRIGQVPNVLILRSSGFVYAAAVLNNRRTLRIRPRPS